MGIRVGIYNFLVNRQPGIRDRYQERRRKVHGMQRIGLWAYLLWMNFAYYILRCREYGISEQFAAYEKKELYREGSESAASGRESPELLAEKLAAYDVISFDVFDTLIFRPFSKPTDLFYFVAEALDYPDFPGIRKEMERRAREERYRKEGDREVTFAEIYAVLERETGIGQEEGMGTELDAECRYCFANPYIVTSDMYLREADIRRILEKAGYGKFDAYYISNEYRCSKHDGKLYERVRQEEGEGRRYVHVGDNPCSDVEKSMALMRFTIKM